MKNILLPILSVILFVSCSSEDAKLNSNKENENPKLVSVETYLLDQHGEQTDYSVYQISYGENGFVNEVFKGEAKDIYLYEGDRVVEYKHYNLQNNTEEFVFKVLYSYQGDKIVKAETIHVSGIPSSSVYYEYNSKDELIYSVDKSTGEDIRFIKHKWKDGNVVRSTSGYTKKEVEYDNKRSLASLLFPESFNKVMGYDKNNPVKIVHSNGLEQKRIYRYDESGYPVKSKLYLENGQQQIRKFTLNI